MRMCRQGIGRERGREKECQACSAPSVQNPTRGSNSRTMRSWPEPRSRVRRSTDWTTQVPLKYEESYMNAKESEGPGLTRDRNWVIPSLLTQSLSRALSAYACLSTPHPSLDLFPLLSLHGPNMAATAVWSVQVSLLSSYHQLFFPFCLLGQPPEKGCSTH